LHQAEAAKSTEAEPTGATTACKAAQQEKPNKEPLTNERAPSSAADTSETLLINVATSLIQHFDPVRDLLAILMRTMLSQLALQMLRIIYKNKKIKSPLFDSILQFAEKGVPAKQKLIPLILRLAPPHQNRPKWMTDGQTDLFGFEYNTEPTAVLFWHRKMLPLSTAAPDLQRKSGVLYSTALYELQALQDALNLAESQLSPEQTFEAAMHHATELHLPAPSTQTLTFGNTQLRPSFAGDFSPAMQRNLAVTTAYALLKFGLSGCSTSSEDTGIYMPTENPVQVEAVRRTHDHRPPPNVDTASRGTQTSTMPSFRSTLRSKC
jgi:hypothetical protein